MGSRPEPLPLSGIRDAATNFRAAIKKCPLDSMPAGMRYFPLGACGDAAPLLGEYFQEIGLGPWQYMTGKRPSDEHTHAWIENDGVIVDITADQFDGVVEQVIVTTDATWHRQFQPMFADRRSIAGIEMWDERTQSYLISVYLEIKARL